MWSNEYGKKRAGRAILSFASKLVEEFQKNFKVCSKVSFFQKSQKIVYNFSQLVLYIENLYWSY